MGAEVKGCSVVNRSDFGLLGSFQVLMLGTVCVEQVLHKGQIIDMGTYLNIALYILLPLRFWAPNPYFFTFNTFSHL